MVSTVEPPLLICRVQWLDFRDCVPVERHEIKYAARFGKLLEAIEHNWLDLDGIQARLQAVLQPIDYDEPALHLPRFCGRDWVNAEVERWLASAGRRVLWITGEAGIGKTALSAWLCERRPEIAGAHYCRYGNASRGGRKALLSLAWQLSTQLVDYESRLNASALDGIGGETSLRGLFDRLFVEPLGHGFPTPGRSVVLLIDALDEASEKGANELASLIGTEWGRTPEWLRLVVTSRPHETEINTALQALDPWLLEAEREESQEDIRAYLRRELRPIAGTSAPDEWTVEAIRARSEGLFLYVRWVREELEAGRLSMDNVEAFPRGLGGIYSAFFERSFPEIREYKERWRPVIETICAARQPLPFEALGKLFPAFYHPNEITSGLGSLFPDSGGGLRPFHQSVRDWVTEKDRAGPYLVRADAGHGRLAGEGWRQYESDPETSISERMTPYFLVHLPAHLAACERKRELAKLLLDPEWMQAKLKATDVSALIADYEYLRPSSEAELVQGALQLSAHVVAGDAGELASQMVGRLLPYADVPVIGKFVVSIASGAPRPWLRPLRPALHPPGTELVRTLEGHSWEVYSVAVTADGKRAVSVSRDKTLKVWDLETGRALRTMQGHSSQVNSVAVTADGKRAVSASADTTLKVWDLETGRELRTMKSRYYKVWDPELRTMKSHFSFPFNSVAVTADTQRVALKYTLEASDPANSVAVTADGKWAVSASADTTLKVWDLETGREMLTLEGHSSPVKSVAVTADGKTLPYLVGWSQAWFSTACAIVSASADHTLKVWALRIPPTFLWGLSGGTHPLARTLEGHSGSVNGVTVTADGKRAVSASSDKTLKVWDLETGRALRTLEGHSDSVNGVTVTADGKRAVSASSDKTLKVWDLETGRALRTLEGHSDSVNGVTITADGKRAVSASSDKTLKVWNLAEVASRAETGGTPHALEDRCGSIVGLKVTAGVKMVFSACDDGRLEVWDAETGRALRTLKGHSSVVTCMAVTADGKRALSASDDETLRVWDLDTGRELHRLEGHSSVVTCVAVTADGKRAVSASLDESLRVWNLDTGHALRTLKGHSSVVTCMAVTADGKRAVSGSTGTLEVWDLRSGRTLQTLKVRDYEGIFVVAVAANGSRAVFASDDKTLKVWDLETGRALRTMQGHSSQVNSVAVAANGSRAVSASDDKTLKVWDLPTGLPVAMFHCDAAPVCCTFADNQTVIAVDVGGRLHFLRLEERT